MTTITKLYKVIRQEITSKKYLGGLFEVKEVSKQNTLGHEIVISSDVPISAVWINGEQILLPKRNTSKVLS